MGTDRITYPSIVTLIAAYLGLFIGLIDANAINLALPAIRADLGGGISGAQWTIDGRRSLVRYRVDWTEQRHHLSGGLGRALLDRFVSVEWVRRVPRHRALTVTDAGRTALADRFGIDWDG